MPRYWSGLLGRCSLFRRIRSPVTRRIRALSNELVVDAITDHAKVVCFLTYLSQFRVSLEGGSTPDEVIDQRAGACTTFTRTLLALAAAQGMNGRYVNLHNFPPGDGHTVAEILVSGRWRLYDPSFCTYYVPNTEYEALPLSFAEVQRGYRRNPESIRRVAGINRPSLDIYTGRDSFVSAFPAGPIGIRIPMFFPLALDLREQNTLELKNFGTRFQGADWLGAASINQNHHWRLSGLSPGRQYAFVLTPERLGGISALYSRRFKLFCAFRSGAIEELCDHTFTFFAGPAAPWVIHFTAQSSEVIAELSHSYHGPFSRYMRMARYELRSMK